jgi:hypothetical protein
LYQAKVFALALLTLLWRVRGIGTCLVAVEQLLELRQDLAVAPTAAGRSVLIEYALELL